MSMKIDYADKAYLRAPIPHAAIAANLRTALGLTPKVAISRDHPDAYRPARFVRNSGAFPQEFA